MIYFFGEEDVPGQARKDSEKKASEMQAIFLPRTKVHVSQQGAASTSRLGAKESSMSAVENKAWRGLLGYVSYRVCFCLLKGSTSTHVSLY